MPYKHIDAGWEAAPETRRLGLSASTKDVHFVRRLANTLLNVDNGHYEPGVFYLARQPLDQQLSPAWFELSPMEVSSIIRYLILPAGGNDLIATVAGVADGSM